MIYRFVAINELLLTKLYILSPVIYVLATLNMYKYTDYDGHMNNYDVVHVAIAMFCECVSSIDCDHVLFVQDIYSK